uniref:Uncharacterized protein n=1 Tax=Solanum tuberosum TaxID=4113 RepID=M1AKC2_SOLTU
MQDMQTMSWSPRKPQVTTTLAQFRQTKLIPVCIIKTQSKGLGLQKTDRGVLKSDTAHIPIANTN